MKLDLLKVTAAELQGMLAKGELTSLELVRHYHKQMVKHNEKLKAMISISPLSYTEKIARKLDEERSNGAIRGPLHGIPFIIKVGECS